MPVGTKSQLCHKKLKAPLKHTAPRHTGTHLLCLQLKLVETLNHYPFEIMEFWHSDRAVTRNGNKNACMAWLNLSTQIYCKIVTWLVLELRAGFGEAEVMLVGREGCGMLMLLELAMLSNDWKVIILFLGG